jgi:ribonuclease BN (tRNA processing enzyme)
VLAPPGLRRRSYFADDHPYLDWREIDDGASARVGDLTLHFGATDHAPTTLAVRVDSDGAAAAFAYSADSGPAWTVSSLGDGIGTFLCEATYTQEHEGSFRHMSGRQAATMAREAAVERLVLTHRWPTVSAEAVRREAEESFGRPVGQAALTAVFDW